MNILDKIMKPRSIAVVGASTKQHTIGSDIMKRLREYGYAGPVYPVNPKGGVIEGLPAYATVLDIPGEVDLAVIIVNARFVLQTIDQCHEKGIKGLCVISAGFKETGTEGARLEAELLERVRRYGMRCVGPNCLGVVNTHPAVRMDACFAEALPERGNIGFVSQSGALGGGILNILRDLNLGFAQFISIGNQADVNAETALEYWEGDKDVRQILLYMESIQNPVNFRRIASRLSKKKPVLALKAGRSAAGASAASSHTGSLAGADLAADALLRQSGVIREFSLKNLFATAKVFANCPIPKGDRVAIVTNSGGPGIMGADAICFFQWRQSKSGAEAFHSAMLPHAGADSKVFRGVCELGKALKTLSDAGLQGTELERAGTAILFSAESEWATRSETLPSMKLNHWHDVRDWYRGFLDAGLRADVVPLAYDWTGYKTIVLPTVLSLSDEDVRRIADFAKTGGTVIVGYATGLVDEYFHIGLGGYPGAGNGLLRDMLGIRSEEFNILGEEAEGEPSEISLSNGLTTRLWQNDVTSVAADTTVLASYAGESAADWELERTPAITSRPYGNGTAIYVGCDLNRHDIAQLLKALGSRWRELSAQPTEGGQTPTYPTTDPRILHTIRRSADGSTRFDFYLNRSNQPVAINGVEGDPIIAHRCETDAVGYTLNRNAILIAKTSC